MASGHQTVLLEEAVAALMTTADGLYVDGTFGRGGHSAAILEALSPVGRLLAFDKDPAAATAAEHFATGDSRFQFCHQSFADLPSVVTDPVDGILLDLGVSSPQLDESERGFSFRDDGPLDMRMDTRSGLTAAEWLNRVDAADLAAVLKEYGEERFAKRIAAAIIEQRPFSTTGELARVVAEANPRWEKHKHPATRAFQAIRIFINRELEDLQRLLDGLLDCLSVGGRLVIISFHSLEDRMVKRFMRDAARGVQLPRGVPVTEAERGQTLRIIGKAQRPSDQEVAANLRARSAVMRVAERVA
jgi:16S rRNA (cytosine1402-N4)-methyltransferase